MQCGVDQARSWVVQYVLDFPGFLHPDFAGFQLTCIMSPLSIRLIPYIRVL